MLSERTVTDIEAIARAVGFGPREDYPHVGSAVSAGDWKGDSVVVSVFQDRDHAETFVKRCLPTLTTFGGLGGAGEGVQMEVVAFETLDRVMWVAVLSGIDLMTVTEYAEYPDGAYPA